MYSQYNEEEIILDFFKRKDPNKLIFLDIGANDGISFSNTHQLALNGWGGVCLEPSFKAYLKLLNLYRGNLRIKTHNFGISDSSSKQILHESKNWIGRDDTPVAILATLNSEEKNRFSGMEWEEVECQFKTFADFTILEKDYRNFDFINIDCEGHDLKVLEQLDLRNLGCQMICLEHAGKPDFITGFSAHCQKHGMRELERNKDNIIFCV